MPDKTVAVTDSSFADDVLKAAGPVLVDFWAEWNGPSKMTAPLLDDAAAAYAGRLTIARLNIDKDPETAPKYDVKGLPTLLLFRNGKVVATKVGALSEGQLREFLDANL